MLINFPDTSRSSNQRLLGKFYPTQNCITIYVAPSNTKEGSYPYCVVDIRVPDNVVIPDPTCQKIADLLWEASKIGAAQQNERFRDLLGIPNAAVKPYG
jgi:hypothetical protein